MAEIIIKNETPLSPIELKEKLEDIKKRDKTLNPKALKTMEYLDKFAKINKKQAEEIKKKIQELDISRIKEKHVAKLIDLMPEDIDSLKIIFASENLTLKQEDLQKILEIIKNV